MPSKLINILEFNEQRKFDKTPSIAYVDLEFLIEIIDWFKNKFEKFSIPKVGEHVSCGYLTSAIWSSDSIENKYDV